MASRDRTERLGWAIGVGLACLFVALVMAGGVRVLLWLIGLR